MHRNLETLFGEILYCLDGASQFASLIKASKKHGKAKERVEDMWQKALKADQPKHEKKQRLPQAEARAQLWEQMTEWAALEHFTEKAVVGDCLSLPQTLDCLATLDASLFSNVGVTDVGVNKSFGKLHRFCWKMIMAISCLWFCLESHQRFCLQSHQCRVARHKRLQRKPLSS